MAELIGWDLITKPFQDVVADSKLTSRKVTMYALRQTGRKMAKIIKPNVPVYKGSDPRAMVERGNLRRSVSNARKLNEIGYNEFSLAVGPFGRKKAATDVVRYGTGGGIGASRAAHGHGISLNQRGAQSTAGQVRGVPLYRRQIEEQYGYMRAGFASAEPIFRETYEAALAKGFEKYR